jgi:uncharacterized repeat protein (TIGR03803 family)
VSDLVLFKIDSTTGNYSELRRFSTSGGDGISPQSDLVLGPDGVIYGTTRSGGKSNAGTIFKLSPDGNGYGIIHDFTGGLDGGTRNSIGNRAYYHRLRRMDGSTEQPHLVVPIKQEPSSSWPPMANYQVLYRFQGGDDGATPEARLTRQPTESMRDNASGWRCHKCGNYFQAELGRYKNYKVLRHLPANPAGFRSGLRIARRQQQTSLRHHKFGGTYNAGTVFKMNPDGSDYTNLLEFKRRSDQEVILKQD